MANGSTAAKVQPGDRVLLLEPDTGYVHLVVPDGKGTRKQRGLGVFDPDKLVGQAYGAKTMVGAKQIVVLRPSLADLSAALDRQAQIILPKDVSRIVFELGVGPGDRVLESGIGSGAATTALAWAVGTTGKVVVQELRDEFAQFARGNLERSGLADRVEIHIGDLTQGLAASAAQGGPFDAVLLDQPEPWKAIPHLVAGGPSATHPVLAPGARIACYTPQVSQMEQTAKALVAAGFVQVRCLELIERGWEVKEKGARPSFDGLGHTAFLVFGRWIGPPAGSPGA